MSPTWLPRLTVFTSIHDALENRACTFYGATANGDRMARARRRLARGGCSCPVAHAATRCPRVDQVFSRRPGGEVGSGFAGPVGALGAARRLDELAAPAGTVDVMVVNNKPFHDVSEFATMKLI